MGMRGGRGVWVFSIPVFLLALGIAGVGVIVWRGLGPRGSRILNHVVRILGGQTQSAQARPVGPTRLDDPQLSSLRKAAESWRRAPGPKRLVVDQVCLVSDEAAFLEAIAAWDERSFFPILIDEPAWTLPFLRAFRPARVVRYSGRTRTLGAQADGGMVNSPADGNERWMRALEAVSRAWSGPSDSERVLPAPDLPPRWLEGIPPGLVLADPGAPMLAGAVALAAGRFQPLVGLQISAPGPQKNGEPARNWRFGDVLKIGQAWELARGVETRVASVFDRYDQLGDECDFLTLAGDWPYAYSFATNERMFRGRYAVDDLIGRRFEAGQPGGWWNETRQRWAYTGRLLGDPAASVARAMGALFLQPESAILWNTYSDGSPWSDYEMVQSAAYFEQIIPGAGAIVHRAGGQADLAGWHRAVDPVNPYKLVLFNSTGGPDSFTISGGAGRPADLPRGDPAAVAMIHSFSAADPTDYQTIAGRWLAQGAFVYFGAVDEPFLLAFRTPRLIAELVLTGVPFVAALRQGEHELFGFPWRMVYLGDPLFRLENGARTNDAVSTESIGRLAPGAWRKIAPEYASWPVAEIASPTVAPIGPAEGQAFRSENDRLERCLDAAIGELTGPRSARSTSRSVDRSGAHESTLRRSDWRGVLTSIHRDRLAPRLRPAFDALLIDTLGEAGLCEPLMTRLALIPPSEAGFRVWQALENCAMQRLARLVEDGDKARRLGRAFDLWDEVMRLHWPRNSRFPSHFTERVSALAWNDSARRRLWLDRLRRTGAEMAGDSGRHPQGEVVAAERVRVEATLGGLGSSR
jgi:hypothetical protein